jgi:hypothetical protein
MIWLGKTIINEFQEQIVLFMLYFEDKLSDLAKVRLFRTSARDFGMQ